MCNKKLKDILTEEQLIDISENSSVGCIEDPNSFNKQDEEIIALMIATAEDYEVCLKMIDDGDYLVLTDSEAETAWTESIESYIEDIVLQEIPEKYHGYFDDDRFIRDTKMNSTRANELASYDGKEDEVCINDTVYYIYRVN